MNFFSVQNVHLGAVAVGFKALYSAGFFEYAATAAPDL